MLIIIIIIIAFHQTSITFLGCVISDKGVEKVKAFTEWPTME